MTRVMGDPTAVYHLRDAGAARLYIGMTNDLERRLREHAEKWWWPSVDEHRTVVTWHASREEAADDEARQIALHRPPHNVLVVGAQEPVVGPVAWDAPLVDVDWGAVAERLLAEVSPAERARLAGRALADLRDWQVGLKWRRQACVAELRQQGMSLARIGQQLGLHRGRVQQIAEGRSSGGQSGRNGSTTMRR